MNLLLTAKIDPSILARYQEALSSLPGDPWTVVPIMLPGSGLSKPYSDLTALLDVRKEAGGKLDRLLRHLRLEPRERWGRVAIATFSGAYPLAYWLAHDPALDAVALLDSGHALTDPDGTPSDEQLRGVVDLAGRARDGKALLWILHTEIDPVTYPSTSEVAAEIVRLTGPTGGLFRIELSPGATAADHLEVLREEGPEFVREALSALLEARGCVDDDGSIATSYGAPSPAQRPAPALQKGIDVSHHNGAIDWKLVASDGYTFAILRATDGRSFRDKRFEENLAGARAAGLRVGAYHLFRPDHAVEAQVENFLNRYTFELGDIAPVCDAEEVGGEDGRTAVNVLSFCRMIEEATGIRPMIYASPSYIREHLARVPLLGVYPLWIAHWKAASPSIPEPWTSWCVWQASNEGRVAGIAGKVDLNVARELPG